MSEIINESLSVDCVIFGFDFEKLKVLLVERELKDEDSHKEVFKDYTLVGNHVYQDEKLEDAAYRVLYDLTGFDNIYLEQFYTFGHPERLKHPRDTMWLKSIGLSPDARVVTVGYYSLLNIQEVELKHGDRNVAWFPVDANVEFGFDHDQILEKALQALRIKIRTNPIGFELLPAKFTLSQLQKLYEEILGVQFDKRNFRKKVQRMNYLVPLNEKQKGVAHKPAQLFMFSKDVYDKTKKDYFVFDV